ncbi:hypothetical protein CDAR_3201 [Caerostris darwini]|uniref:Uncharacterized protein n=1 Tax=Caerostris darwini TaxID=1538125 RepID=A0AAV4T143_9ARAC|nr:hypothetical protein CDAR_3201 [Caerostris darwini]
MNEPLENVNTRSPELLPSACVATAGGVCCLIAAKLVGFNMCVGGQLIKCAGGERSSLCQLTPYLNISAYFRSLTETLNIKKISNAC